MVMGFGELLAVAVMDGQRLAKGHFFCYNK